MPYHGTGNKATARPSVSQSVAEEPDFGWFISLEDLSDSDFELDDEEVPNSETKRERLRRKMKQKAKAFDAQYDRTNDFDHVDSYSSYFKNSSSGIGSGRARNQRGAAASRSRRYNNSKEFAKLRLVLSRIYQVLCFYKYFLRLAEFIRSKLLVAFPVLGGIEKIIPLKMLRFPILLIILNLIMVIRRKIKMLYNIGQVATQILPGTTAHVLKVGSESVSTILSASTTATT